MGAAEADRRALAGRVAGQAELLAVRLRRATIEQQRFQEQGAVLAYGLDVAPSVGLEPGGRHMTVEVDYVLTVREHDAADDADPVARLGFAFAALFDVGEQEEPFNDDEATSFAQTTGAFALYPYAREFVQDATGRLGLPPLTLGLFKPDLSTDSTDTHE